MSPDDVRMIAEAAAMTLAPALPYLEAFGGKVVDGVAKKIGGDVWDRAKALASRLRPAVKDEPKVAQAVELVRADPEDEALQALLRTRLEALLASREELAAEVGEILGVAGARTAVARDGASLAGDASGDARQQVGGAGSTLTGGDRFEAAGQARQQIAGPGSTQVAGDQHVYHGSAPEKAPSLREAYLRWLFNHLRPLSLSGIDPAAPDRGDGGRRLELDAVFTALLTLGSDERIPAAEREMSRPGRPQLVPALARLDRQERLVLLGDPGSGKSTFVAFVALCMAGELLGEQAVNLELLRRPLPEPHRREGEPELQPWSRDCLLPVRVILRDFAARGLPPAGEPGKTRHLLGFLRSELEDRGIGGFVDELEPMLRDPGGLVLFDGLDEVPGAEERRKQIVETIVDFAEAFGNSRIVVTSRTYAYNEQGWQLPGFRDVTLAPFTEPQIDAFIERWYAHLAVVDGKAPDAYAGRAADLHRAVAGSDRLRALAERPLLLTLMASLHAWHGGTLPERRQQLYEQAVDLLLNRWEHRRVRKRPDGTVEETMPSLAEWLRVDREAIRELLDELAYEAHASQPAEAETADVPEGTVAAGLSRLSETAKANPRLLQEYLRDRAGILEPRGVGVYSFPHRTFQEYLAACHLTGTARDYPEEVAKLARQEPARWREVALLAGAKASEGAASSIWLLAQALCPRELEERDAVSAHDLWGAHLAALALVEAADLGRVPASQVAVVDRLKPWLLRIMEGDELPALERALAGDSLAHLGDPREWVTTCDAMHLCWVPEGPFHMGSDASDEQAFSDEKEAHTVDVPYGYWIGRLPVTQAQFAEFVAAGGYSDAALWPEARAAGVWKDGGVKGRFDSEGRAQPVRFGRSFDLPNHPVVGVGWHEALAFCRWLTRRWSQAGLLEGREVTLPSEAEWEKAARGGTEVPAVLPPARPGAPQPRARLGKNDAPQRIYPWVGGFDTERAATAEGRSGASVAAGCFPRGRSPYGCEDLAGNVWEWTRSAWADYPYPDPGPERGQREDLSAKAPAVVRGGSWLYHQGLARCACRSGRGRVNRLDALGFRVVVVSRHR